MRAVVVGIVIRNVCVRLDNAMVWYLDRWVVDAAVVKAIGCWRLR